MRYGSLTPRVTRSSIITPMISFGAIENDFAALAGYRRRIETCKKSLCRSLFVACGAVDLAGQKQSAQTLASPASASSSRGST